MRRVLASLSLCVLALAGCDATKSDFPVRSDAVRQEVEQLDTSVEVVQITAQNVAQFDRPRRASSGRNTLGTSGGWNYRVGVGDILDVVVWDHPELTMPAGERRTPAESGLRVQADGNFFYPFVGQMPAQGLTPADIRQNLTQRLTEFIPNPQVEVRVVGYNSQAASVTGEVKAPRRLPLTDVPLTLLEAVDAAGGLSEQADPASVTVRRGGRLYSVDLKSFLERGVAGNNPTLQNGDVINVPRLAMAEAYLLGQLVRPATIDLTREDVTLTQAVTRVGGLREDQADARGIFVFRATDRGITVYQLDASNPAAFLLGTRFTLAPRDVVYVTTAPLYRWNRLISSLLPTLGLARTVDQIQN